MKRSLLIVIVLAILSITAQAQQIVPRERTINTVARVGQELRIQNYASYDRDCQPLPVPQITMRHQPAHGTIAIRPGTSMISVIREGGPNCAGHQYPATTVWYVPSPTYSGLDQFDYDIVSTRSTAHDTVVLEVR